MAATCFSVGVGWAEAEGAGKHWKRGEDASEEEKHWPVARCRRQPAEASGRRVDGCLTARRRPQRRSLIRCLFLSLQSLVEASAKRVVNLASQWEKHRAPLIDEHRRLKEICSSQDVSGVTGSWAPVRMSFVFICLLFPQMESSRKLSEIKTLHEKIRVSTEEAKKKEETYKQLVTEDKKTVSRCLNSVTDWSNLPDIPRDESNSLCPRSLPLQVTELESLPQDVSRSAYTQRILEIVSNIKKQKEEITKVWHA